MKLYFIVILAVLATFATVNAQNVSKKRVKNHTAIKSLRNSN